MFYCPLFILERWAVKSLNLKVYKFHHLSHKMCSLTTIIRQNIAKWEIMSLENIYWFLKISKWFTEIIYNSSKWLLMNACYKGIKVHKVTKASAGEIHFSIQSTQFSSVQFSSVAQLCPTLCNPMDCSPPDPSVHGILQLRILQWVAIDRKSVV